jgi:hypothetical protein
MWGGEGKGKWGESGKNKGVTIPFHSRPIFYYYDDDDVTIYLQPACARPLCWRHMNAYSIARTWPDAYK